MRPNWPELPSPAKKICTLWCQFYDAFFTSKGDPLKNIFQYQQNVLYLTEVQPDISYLHFV